MKPLITERVIQLFGARTGNSLRVSIALEEAQLPYTVKLVDLRRGEHRRQPYLALNPDGKVPIIIDQSTSGSSFLLTQSNAILFYIAEQAPGSLLPEKNSMLRALVFERFFYFLTDVIAPSHSAFRLRLGGGQSGTDDLDQYAMTMLMAAERFLETSRFMAGDKFSLADVAAFTIALAYQQSVDWQGAPNLKSWFDLVSMRPAVIRGLRAFD
jgi:GSH-dependent disulfide-bond oxidoreductase